MPKNSKSNKLPNRLPKDHELLKQRLALHDFSPDLETMDQVMLVNLDVFRELVKVSCLRGSDIVLEIGPGTGELLRILSSRVKTVIGIELDTRFSRFLSILPSNVRIIYANALGYISKDKGTFNKIVSSPPYNVCEPLLHVLTRKPFIESVSLITPLGFFSKVSSSPIFSSFFVFERFSRVRRSDFFPVPRIDSEIIRITHRPDYESDNDMHAFIVRSLYLQRNKKIRNSLRSTLINLSKLDDKHMTKNMARSVITSLGLENDLLISKMHDQGQVFYKILADRIINLL